MKTTFFSLIMALYTLIPAAQAGVFNIPEFVDYKNWALGVEPELTLTPDSGIAGTVKFTYGITPLSNLQVGIGSGSGDKQFRLGGTYTFDVIPDIEGQIGAGIALQGYVYHIKSGGSLTELTGIPYIHNTFRTAQGQDFDPYVALPLGMSFNDGNYRSIFQIVGGTYFKLNPHIGYNAELGVNIKDTDTYISVGATYRN
jgi:hypothetical protein